MHLDHKAVKALTGKSVVSFNLLCILARFFAKTTVRRNGLPAVAMTCQQLAEIIGCERPAVSKAIASLEGKGLVRVDRGRWNRAPRLYLSVPRATYEKAGAAPPDNCAFYDGSTRPAFIGNAPDAVQEPSQSSTGSLLDLQSKKKSEYQSESAPATACGSASPVGSAVDPEVSGKVFSGGKMSGLKQRAEKTVAQAVIGKADEDSIPVAALYAREMRAAGYACAPDAAFKGNVSTLQRKAAARGVDFRHQIKAMIERWPQYRAPNSPKRPEPWAVAKQLDAFCALPAPAQAPAMPPPPPPMPAKETPPQQPPVKHQSIFLKALKEQKT